MTTLGVGMDKPFTMIPNELIRTLKIDHYDKIILIVIASFNPSFPSYETIQKFSGLSRERVWKSLMKLDETGLVRRYRGGKSTLYYPYWISSPDELAVRRIVRPTNCSSSPDELTAVRQTNCNKNNLKRTIKKSEEIFVNETFETQNRDQIVEIIEMSLKGMT